MRYHLNDIFLSREVGACAYGVVEIGETSSAVMSAYEKWLNRGFAAGMGYLANHLPIRSNPDLLLTDAKYIISVAFPYSPSQWRNHSLPVIASYAYGEDYHDVLRKRLKKAVESLQMLYGGEYRICIDSAPIFERYWAEKCGIGKRSDNGLIAVHGYGTRVFLAEILSTAELPLQVGLLKGIEENINRAAECLHCGSCRRACPAGALQSDTTVDARKCLSYLTIEQRGDWNEIGEMAMKTAAGRYTLFGCDLCQQVCPMNSPLNPAISPTEIEEFKPSEAILTLNATQAQEMTQEEFSRIFKGSPIKRAKLAGFLRNAANLR